MLAKMAVSPLRKKRRKKELQNFMASEARSETGHLEVLRAKFEKDKAYRTIESGTEVQALLMYIYMYV